MEDNSQESGLLKNIDLKVIIDKVLNYLYHYLWMILLFVAVGASFMWYRAKISYVPYYQSTVTCTISNEFADYSDSNYLLEAKNLANMFGYLTETSTFREMLKNELGTEIINGIIGAYVSETSNLLTITVTSANPQDAYNILNATIKCYPDIAEYVVGKVYFHVITPADIPDAPVNTPDYKTPAQKGAIMGGGLIIIIFILMSVFDNRINDRSDIEKRMNIKCLAVVPEIKSNKRRKTADVPITILNKKVGYAFKECYRSIRTRIKKFCSKNNCKVILVTSAMPGEGKTTTSVNIALSLAEISDKVVLVDGDLRKPTVREKLRISEDSFGIDMVLKGKATLEESLVSIDGTKLKVLSGNVSVKNALECMGSDEMKAVIDELRDKFEYIIIDTPPCSIMSDASMIARFVDGVVMVVRCSKSKINYITNAMDIVMSNDISMVGCVLNGKKEEVSDVAYGYRYGSYRYGYNKYGKYYKYGGKYAAYGYGGGDSDSDKD